MKNTNLIKVALSVLIIMGSCNVLAGDWTGHVSGYVGTKSLNKNDWNDLDSQTSLGIISDFKKKSWPVSIALDAIVSGDSFTEADVKTTGGSVEYHLGVRKVYDLKSSAFQPYIGGGVAVVSAEIKQTDGDDRARIKKSPTGGWVGAGSYYQINSNFVVGLDVRYSKAEATVDAIKRDAGGLHAGFTIGYQW